MAKTGEITHRETWPTPVATDGTHGGRVTPRKSREGGNLIEAVAARTAWPTPTVRLAKNGDCPSERERKTPNLNAAVRMFPTPTTQDAANNGGPSQSERNTPPLNAIVGGLLNPDWVEWLMGWPVGWTDTTRDDVESHDWTAEPCPRVTTRRDLRAPRLKQCGNGQVPQCAAMAWRILTSRPT